MIFYDKNNPGSRMWEQRKTELSPQPIQSEHGPFNLLSPKDRIAIHKEKVVVIPVPDFKEITANDARLVAEKLAARFDGSTHFGITYHLEAEEYELSDKQDVMKRVGTQVGAVALREMKPVRHDQHANLYTVEGDVYKVNARKSLIDGIADAVEFTRASSNNASSENWIHFAVVGTENTAELGIDDIMYHDIEAMVLTGLDNSTEALQWSPVATRR